MSSAEEGTNPYAPPRAPLEHAAAVGTEQFLPKGRAVAAGRGWNWLVDAWPFFTAAPGTWIGIGVVFLLMMIGLSIAQSLLALIPVAGPILGGLPGSLLTPVFVTGMVIGCAAIRREGKLEFNHLFEGFKGHFGRIAMIGAITFVASVVVGLIGGLIAGEDLAMVAVDSLMNLRLPATRPLLGILVALALFIPVMAAAWFAPTLAVFHDLRPLAAMKSSLIGGLRNFFPMLVYGLVGILPAVLASLPLMLGWLVLGPVFVASIYTAYRDIYLR